ncbi:MAG: AraC family transcriptional regulator [Acidobacteria bacterium]|nr:AraC family transcriptional regulator [Acidobacteriota bacterium]
MMKTYRILSTMLQDLKIGRQYEGFIFLAESSRNAPKQLVPHHHVELELNLVIRGNITYVVEGQRFTFSAGMLLWLYPEQEHQLVDRSPNAQNYIAVFKPSFIRRSCRTPAYAGLRCTKNEKPGVLHTMLDPDAFDLIRKTMDAVMVGSLDADVLNRQAGFGLESADFTYQHFDPDGLNAGLHHLLLLCWRYQRAGESLAGAVTLHPCVRRALQMMSEADWEGSLSSLAKKCGASEAHLSRTFHRQIGVPISRYRNSLRLARFWEEYRQPDQKNIAEAVYAAGFGSYAQFYKVFVEAYGRSPRACLTSSQI